MSSLSLSLSLSSLYLYMRFCLRVALPDALGKLPLAPDINSQMSVP